MPKIKSGVSQIGGKFRLCNTIMEFVPYHEFYLEPFLGSAIVLLNKPRCRYECGNDLNSELINYYLVTREYPKEFDELKQGIFGLVSQEICNRIVRGELVPRNNIERAYFYYYLNKLTFGGGIWMVRKDPPWKGIDPADQAGKFDSNKEEWEYGTKGYPGILQPAAGARCTDKKGIKKSKEQYQEKVYETTGGGHGIISRTGGFMNRNTDIEKAKDNYEIKTKGFAGIGNPRAGLPTLHDKDFEKIKANYEWKTKGYIGLIDQKQQNARIDSKGVKEAKSTYAGLINSAIKADPMDKESVDKSKEDYKWETKGYIGIMNDNDPIRKKSIQEAKQIYQKQKNAQIKGINPKTTRPFTNNDCGLLTPLQSEAIKRLRYVNLTCYPFQKVYNMFYQAFHIRKGLGPECFVYVDSPYVGSEAYYKSGFGIEDHNDNVNNMIESPFHVLMSIGSKDDEKSIKLLEELYLEPLKDAGMLIIPVKVRYSTDANSQKLSTEYLIMNYDINELPLMQFESNQNTIERWT